ncbi:retinol dehydrogenase 8 isoform X1 [Mesocricetus auratus]|uniref:Retinol dehydrogenase 8 isoform X1 n=1 Tax=Mesocricetus auratus TaxID=10036 RepID=A0ABM2WCJ0_MESAU|nr:retinol dehydrogenase 8 isoform X1 [Mesocricetus auratus]
MASQPRRVLISGCSSGIGLELAVLLAQDPRQRYQVVATMRDLGKKESLEAAAGDTLGKTLSIAQLDVCSDESVANCLSRIEGQPVDVLGVMFNDVYAASKFALEGFFESLAIQLRQFNIFVSMVEPGPVATHFEGKLLAQVSMTEFPDTDPDTLGYFRDMYLPASRELFRSVGQSPRDVAQVIAKVIGSTRPPLRRQTNARYLALTVLKAVDPSGSLYVRTAHRLLFHWPHLLSLGLRCLACSCLPTRVRPE